MENEAMELNNKDLLIKMYGTLQKIETEMQNLRERVDDNNETVKQSLIKHEEQLIALEARVRVLELEQAKNSRQKTTWEKIKDSFINWLVPFLCLALIAYIAGGAK